MYNTISWLIEYAEAEEGVIDGDLIQERVTALKQIPNWRSMKGPQLKEVLTTSNFATYFADALSRLFYKDYDYQTGEWRNYIFLDSAPDFREVKRFRMTEPGTLYERGEKGEPKADDIEASLVEYGVHEFSRAIDFSWRTIQNDDLGKIRETPQRMVRAATRHEDSFVSNLYDNATSQAALVALGPDFAQTGRLTAANLAIGWAAMQKRLDEKSNPINIGSVHLVIPPILKLQASQILSDTINFGGPDSNVIGNFISGVWTDPYITTTATAAPWYLFADPSDIPAVSLVRLEGFDRPFAYGQMSDISMISGSAPAAFMLGSAQTGNINWFVENMMGGFSDPTLGGITDTNGIYFSDGTTP